MRLKGKTALITGSSRGIGKAIALAYAGEGANVVVNYASNKDAADEVVAEIQKMGGDSVSFKADVSMAADAEALVQKGIQEFGGLDILVNNAGFGKPAMLLEMTEDQWDQVIDIHLKGAFFCTQFAARHMKERIGGKIINVTSVAGIVGTVGQVNYSAAKGGILSFTKSAARELAKYNICVNAISPGIIVTDMTEKIMTNEKLKDIYMNRILLKRFAEPDEISPAFVFLGSQESSYITGQILCVDGGYGMA
jgi:3-oxoacyl-[acyl-carrier protein] reductase